MVTDFAFRRMEGKGWEGKEREKKGRPWKRVLVSQYKYLSILGCKLITIRIQVNKEMSFQKNALKWFQFLLFPTYISNCGVIGILNILQNSFIYIDMV